MDEFSWFVGIYEGEGSMHVNCKNLIMEINMTDEDTIARVSKFLGVKYRKRVVKKGKPIYVCRKKGGCTRGKLYDLLMKMKPHLSKRRQEQFETNIHKLHKTQVKYGRTRYSLSVENFTTEIS